MTGESGCRKAKGNAASPFSSFSSHGLRRCALSGRLAAECRFNNVIHEVGRTVWSVSRRFDAAKKAKLRRGKTREKADGSATRR